MTNQLLIRNLDKETLSRLAERAKQHGRSREEEVRQILQQAVKRESFQEWLERAKTMRKKQPLQPSSTAEIRQMREER